MQTSPAIDFTEICKLLQSRRYPPSYSTFFVSGVSTVEPADIPEYQMSNWTEDSCYLAHSIISDTLYGFRVQIIHPGGSLPPHGN